MTLQAAAYISIEPTPYQMRNFGLPAIGIALSSLVSIVDAQSPVPPRRAHHSLIYDESRKAIVLTGGSTQLDGGSRYDFFNDLWVFDGTKWTPMEPSGNRLSGATLAYDTKRGRVVSFGGFSGTASLPDVRMLEANTWKGIGEHTAMPAAEAGFIYDTEHDRFFAFGGSGGRGRTYGDTWQYDGTTWTNLNVSGPAARQAHVMVFDPARKRTVVFGGMGLSQAGQRPPLLGDTWEFDGMSWKRVDAQGPSPRSGAGVTYDSKRRLVILFGGADSAGFKGDTWSWDGNKWKQIAASGPEPRVMGYIAYDKARDRVVLFGGRKGFPDGDLADTWEWDGVSWRESKL